MRLWISLRAAFGVNGQVASTDLRGEVRDESSAAVPANVTERHDPTGSGRPGSISRGQRPSCSK